MKKLSCLFILMFLVLSVVHAGNKVKRLSDVVYDHRDGAALVLDALIPERQNGMAVFVMVSGGWSSFNAANYPTEGQAFFFGLKNFTDKGITVFLISHGSRPRYKVPEIIDQVQRAIRYVRYNTVMFGVDPQKFGIIGSSSGGHLSVSCGVFGKDEMSENEYRKAHSLKDSDPVDPVDLVSSKVQAVACFFPPTNLVNYNHPDSTFADFKNVAIFLDAFDFTKSTSKEKIKEIFRQSSPYFFITRATPPMLIFHGTKDLLVPYSQSVSFIEKLKENSIPGQLVTKEGAGHGWPYNKADDETMIKWFEKYLLAKH